MGNILWLWNELNKIAKWRVLQSISPLCYVPVFLQRIWCFSNPDQNKCSTFWLTPPSKKDATPTCHPVWVASRCSWEESNCKQAERWTFHTPVFGYTFQAARLNLGGRLDAADIMSEIEGKSNALYLYSPKSQSHCLSGLYKQYNERHPRLDPRFEWGKTFRIEKNT